MRTEFKCFNTISILAPNGTNFGGVYNSFDYIDLTPYGGSAFTRYVFFERFVAHAEFEVLSVQQNFGVSKSDRVVVPIGLIGGGYSSNGFQLMLLYDLIGNPYNPYIGTFGPNSRVYLRAGFLINL